MNTVYWSSWFFASLALGLWLAWGMFGAGDPAHLMPGPLSPGHHQFEQACDTCHTDPLGGDEVLQAACLRCHEDIRRKPLDSHPRAKFTDPRNADRLEEINALVCVSCHTEHRPEITAKNGVTQPRDVCFHCHDGIAEDRPSHEGMAFDTCTNAGCHNFHDNRALYTDFLVKHLEDPELRERARVPGRELASSLAEVPEYPHDRYPLEPVTEADSERTLEPDEHQDWLTTAHARAGVNCTACHQQPEDADNTETGTWIDKPGTAACETCHSVELDRFTQGKHGMRLAAGLPPMTPAEARMPMRSDAAHRELTCLTCHGAHDFDVVAAAVDACLGCHDDKHSLAYNESAHAGLWRAEVEGSATAGSGVSCATCHMPRIEMDINDWVSRIGVEHNQSAALAPNSKMIRPACLHCHGLGFSLDSLADAALVARNFIGRPVVTVASMRLARDDQQRHLKELEATRK